MAVPLSQPQPQSQAAFQWPKQFEPDEATLALAARLKAGPVVGASPTTVMRM